MPNFNFDYTSVMLMKMFLSRPAEEGSEVLINFDHALNIIKRTDEITQHIPKIIYLVGWQYRGHDDRYPDIFSVNDALKSEKDSSAYDSLMRLITEAKKFNTTVSFHINFTDAYDDAEGFSSLKEAGALIRDNDENDLPVEKYNGKDCYKISYKEYWESGLFQKHFDRFLEFMPIVKELKTIHVDNFQCYFNNNPDIHVREMQTYRNKMIDYVSAYGIDITSEGVYRECEEGKDTFNCNVPKEIMLRQPVATLDRIPALWWLSPYGDDDFLNIPFSRLCGGIPGDDYYKVFYGSPHGEDVWMNNGCKDGEWEDEFIDKFARELVPYRYICNKKCIKIETTEDNFKIAYFDDGTISDGWTATLTKGDETLKTDSDVAMPVVFLKDTFLFYSRNETELSVKIKEEFQEAELFRVSPEGNIPLGHKKIGNGLLTIALHPRECILAALV